MAIQKDIDTGLGFTLNGAYLRLDFLAIDLFAGAGRFIFNVFASAEAANTGKPPVKQIAFDIGSQAKAAVYKTNDAGKYVDAEGIELQDQDNVELRVVERPAILSMMQLIGKYPSIYLGLKAAVYGELKTQPELAGGLDV